MRAVGYFRPERRQVQPGKRDNVVHMVWSGAHHWWLTSQCVGNVRKLAVALTVFGAVMSPVSAATASAATASAGTIPATTTSYYERTASPKTLYRQGEKAGKAAAQGIVILDFGRPGVDGPRFGMMAYSGAFVSFAAIEAGVKSYIRAYYRYAPGYTKLNVAVGTNNSCGAGQPCGVTLSCGCPDEPPNFVAWGQHFGLTVEQLDNWAGALRAQYGYTDQVRAVAADDAEPAYDPGYQNTFDVLKGYANFVAGTFPPMVDFGSAESNYWTEAQLLQVADGFRPDVPMPQIYYANQAEQWAGLLHYAKTHLHKVIDIYGVLTMGAGTNTPQIAYADMLQALSSVTDQGTIPWLSTIHR
jgi:hypothetical protein